MKPRFSLAKPASRIEEGFNAGVVELVDAPDSKSGSRDGVSVRFRPPAPWFLGKTTTDAIHL